MSGADIKKRTDSGSNVLSQAPLSVINLLPSSVQDDPSAAGYPRAGARDCWHWRNALSCHTGDRHWPGHPVQANTAGTQCHSQAAPAQPENQSHQPFLSPVPSQGGQGGILLLHPGKKPIPKAEKANPKLSSFTPRPALPCTHSEPGLESSC